MSQIVNNRPGRFRQTGGKLEVALDKALLSGEAFAMIGAPPKGGTEAPLPANAVRLRRGSRPQREEAAKKFFRPKSCSAARRIPARPAIISPAPKRSPRCVSQASPGLLPAR